MKETEREKERESALKVKMPEPEEKCNVMIRSKVCGGIT